MSDATPSIRAVIFDLYGTLLREPPFDHCYPALAAEIGVSLADYERARQSTLDAAMVGHLPTATARAQAILACLNRSDRDIAAKLAALEREARWSRVLPYPAAVETLTDLRDRGFRLGLVSDCAEMMGRSLLRHFDLERHFDAIALSYEVGQAKPDPRIYRVVTDRLGVVPSACVYVGDGGSDEMAGARALGMATIRIDQEDSFGRSGYPGQADHVIVRLDEILQLPLIVPNRVGFPRLDVAWVRSDLAVGGQVDPANLPRLKTIGIGAIVDLRIEESDNPDLLASHGLSFLHLPMHDEHALTQDQLRDGSRWIAEKQASGTRVLVHCRHGVGRSVMLAAAVLVNDGLSVTDALDQIKTRRPRMALSANQLAAMYEYRP